MKEYLLTEEEIQAIKDKWHNVSWAEVSSRWDEFYADFIKLMDDVAARYLMEKKGELKK